MKRSSYFSTSKIHFLAAKLTSKTQTRDPRLVWNTFKHLNSVFIITFWIYLEKLGYAELTVFLGFLFPINVTTSTVNPPNWTNVNSYIVLFIIITKTISISNLNAFLEI